jgi:hypothetical protein
MSPVGIMTCDYFQQKGDRRQGTRGKEGKVKSRRV